jgi:uncharacterized membrane protein
MEEQGKPVLRDSAVDWLRGIAMVLMVLDHARDFWHRSDVRPLDLASTTPILFATRWVTHFCAPAFVFFAGVAAHLHGRRRTPADNAHFLLTRGAFLVLLEITLIRVLWVPDPFYQFTLLQVIWAIGWSMVLLSTLTRLPRRAVLVFGALCVAGHNAFDHVHASQFGPFAPVWNLLHERAPLLLAPGHTVLVSYPLVPWVGVMALGYASGPLVELGLVQRRRLFLRIGGSLTLAFLVLRALNGYGDPHPWSTQKEPLLTALSFINCEKYPPSLDYLLMTLGPTLVLFALGSRWASRSSVLATFGKAPLVFYVSHLFILRATSLAFMTTHLGLRGVLNGPRGFRFSAELPLFVTYVAWLVTVVALYPLCRWYANLKATRHPRWTSYV